MSKKSYEAMMQQAVQKVREHDGTNRRGITVRCQVCETPLIAACEIEVCARCLIQVGARIKTRLKKEWERAREGKA